MPSRLVGFSAVNVAPCLPLMTSAFRNECKTFEVLTLYDAQLPIVLHLLEVL